MKQTTNMQRSIQYLTKIFKLLNDEYFDGELEQPIITVQSTPKAYGHFTPWQSWDIKESNGNTKKTVEINIGAGTLDRPIENVVATMLHEMVHYYCYVKGIKDTSRGGQYHNSKGFKAEAEKRALHLEYDNRIGWSITSPTEELIDFILANQLEDIRIGRNEGQSFYIGIGGKAGNGTTTPPTKKPTNTRKYICPCCSNSFRATKNINVLCMDCNEQYIIAQ